MKKLTLILLFALGAGMAFSQPYVRLNAGYALPLGSQLIGEETNTTYNPNTGEESGDTKGIYGSYGSGLSIHAAFGNSFKGSPIGYDLEVGYLFGKKYEVTTTSTYAGNPPDRSTESSSSRSLQISPSIFIKTAVGKFEPYTRVGPVLALTKSTIEYGSDFFDVEVELTGGFNIGVKGALGVNFTPTKKTQFFTEISFISLAYAPKEGEITKFFIDGVDELDNLTNEEKKISFEKEYQFSDSSSENVEIRENYSMGSIAIQVGVKFTL